jgi:hypothetical protein
MVNSDNPVAVGIITYEVARVLESARLEYLKTGNIRIPRDTIEISEDSSIKTLLSYLKEGKNEEPSKKLSYLDIPELKEIFECYGIEEDDLKHFIASEAVDYLVSYGPENIVPSLYEIAEMVVESNKYYEAMDQPGILQRLMEADAEDTFKKRGFSKAAKDNAAFAYRGAKKRAGQAYTAAAETRPVKYMKGKYGKVKGTKAGAAIGRGLSKTAAVAKKNKVASGVAVGAAGTLAAAALLRRRKKNKQANESVAVLESQRHGCGNSSNPTKCRESLNKYIDRWNSKI